MRIFTTPTCSTLSVFLLLAASASGETMYVSSEGSAESPFTSWETAAGDITSALDVVKDGDQIVVAPGTYPVGHTIVVNRAVTLRSAAGARKTVLNGKVSTADLTSDKDGWIALAPLVQADRDLQDAGWKWDGHSASFSAGKPRAVVSIPVRIAGSYELKTRVTITRAKETTAIWLPITSSRAVVLDMRGDLGNSESPTATIRLTGLKPDAEPPGNLSMDIGAEYALSCKVLVDGNKVAIEIPKVDEIQRGKQAKLPKRIWPAALEAVRTGMAKNFGDMTLKEDRRSHAPHESRILRYQHGRDGLDITLSCYSTPCEAAKALRFCDRHVSVKTFSTRPGEEFRLEGVGDEAYRYFPGGSVIMCYSNIFVVINGRPSDLKAKAAKVIADCLENVAESASPKILDPGVNDVRRRAMRSDVLPPTP